MHPQQRFGNGPLNMTAYTQSPFHAQYPQEFYEHVVDEEEYA